MVKHWNSDGGTVMVEQCGGTVWWNSDFKTFSRSYLKRRKKEKGGQKEFLTT